MQDLIFNFNTRISISFFVSLFLEDTTKCSIKTEALTLCSVQKCSIANGGCDASAICTNPTTADGDVVCSCAAGKQFASDSRTCTSTAEADLHCPTSTCWSYEMVDGNKKCVMKLRVWNWKFYQSAARLRSDTLGPVRPLLFLTFSWKQLKYTRSLWKQSL